MRQIPLSLSPFPRDKRTLMPRPTQPSGICFPESPTQTAK